jgi:hypothetical protein
MSYPRKLLLLACILLFVGSTFGQTPIEPKYRLPKWVFLIFENDKSFRSKYEISDYINPFYLEGDFNGDSLIDVAIAIKDKSTQKRGIIIVNQSNKGYFIIGAGKTFGHGRDDFDWLDMWSVYRDKFIEDPGTFRKTVELNHPAILVEAFEKFSAIIYWNGAKYVWFQQGI